MIRLSPRAARHVRALRQHDEGLGRPEATRNLILALENAWATISTNPNAGRPTPRAYPQIARPGRAWIKSGRYWIGYTITQPR